MYPEHRDTHIVGWHSYAYRLIAFNIRTKGLAYKTAAGIETGIHVTKDDCTTKTMGLGKYFSGTSGLVLPYKNKTLYPPEFQERSRLTYYGSLFNSIEINSSFYKVPKAATVEKWADSVPRDFQFTFKLWKEITHTKGLVFDPEMVAGFMQTINFAKPKTGCLLVQFPPGFKLSGWSRFLKLVQAIETQNLSGQWNIAFEFRDTSWYRNETFDMLHKAGAGMVIHDKAGSQSPVEDTDADFVYLRFHGPGGNYRGSYDDHFLHEYAYYIRDWLIAGKHVYVYFNNTMGDAIKNLRSLNAYVRELTSSL